jgi:hypothetical protein
MANFGQTFEIGSDLIVIKVAASLVLVMRSCDGASNLRNSTGIGSNAHFVLN